MEHKSSVRLITRKEGINLLQKSTEILNNETVASIIRRATIIKTDGDFVYLGWESLNNICTYLLIHSVDKLEGNDISYRLTTIGENLYDIEEYSYTNINDENVCIPYPQIERTFDDEYIENESNGHMKSISSLEEMETIEYE